MITLPTVNRSFMLEIDGQEFEVFCNISVTWENTSFDHEFGTEVQHAWDICLEDFETTGTDPVTGEQIEIEADGLEAWLIDQIKQSEPDIIKFAEDMMRDYDEH